MPRYSPIEIPVPLAASRSDLVAFQWGDGDVTADFLLPDDDERAIRVTFNKPCIIRILDEMPLSTENDGRSEGLVRDHFAYRVEGSAFFDAQSEAWKLANAPVKHYRFITGWACMDVLSSGRPLFMVIERSHLPRSPKSLRLAPGPVDRFVKNNLDCLIIAFWPIVLAIALYVGNRGQSILFVAGLVLQLTALLSPVLLYRRGKYGAVVHSVPYLFSLIGATLIFLAPDVRDPIKICIIFLVLTTIVHVSTVYDARKGQQTTAQGRSS